MYYICERKPQSVDTLYGIKDMESNTVEYYSARDIIHFIETKKIEISGVIQDEKTDRWSLTIVYPNNNRQFVIVDLSKDSIQTLAEQITLLNASNFASDVRVMTASILSCIYGRFFGNKSIGNMEDLGLIPATYFSKVALGNVGVRVKNRVFRFKFGKLETPIKDENKDEIICTSKNAFIQSIDFKFSGKGVKKVSLNFAFYNDGNKFVDMYFTPASCADEEWYSKVRKEILGFDSGVNVYSGKFKDLGTVLGNKVIDSKLESDTNSLMLTDNCEDMMRIRNITKLVCKLLKANYEDAYISDKAALSVEYANRRNINLDVRGMNVVTPVRVLKDETMLMIAIPKKDKTSTITYIIGGNRIGVSIASKKRASKNIDIMYRQYTYKEMHDKIKAKLAKEV